MRDWFDWKGKWMAKAAYAVVLALLASFPLWAGDYDVVLVSRVLCFAILALSMDLLWGYSGLLSFGHGAFFGMGSYLFGLTLKYMSLKGIAYISLLFGVLGPVVVAAILGYFLFYGRVSGIYFGIITLALTLILQSLVNHPDAFEITGGQNGLYGSFLAPKYGIPGLWEYKRTLRSNFANYYTAMAGFVLAFIFCKVLVKSFFGKILKAIKNNEDRLEFLGYNVANYKIAVFCIACWLVSPAPSLSPYTS
jgi:ABC-type branched-subunit amino acid transport system permease subunit